MTATLKVYGWQGTRANAASHPDGQPWSNQTREIVAAASEAAVARAAKVSRPRQLFNLGETGNAKEIEVAMSKPGIIFWRPYDSRSGKWVESPSASPALHPKEGTP